MTALAPDTALVVEDLPSARAWLVATVQEAFPGIEVRTAATLASARDHITEAPPALALIDLGLPDGSGTTLIEELTRAHPDTRCVVSTIFNDDVHLFPALRAGACGYLLKDQPREVVVRALRGILSGEPPLSPAIARRLLKVFAPETSAQHADTRLSPRERESLTYIAKGLKLSEVASQLGVTRNTAAGYLKAVYRKLNVSSRAEATIEAVRMGLARADL